MVWPSCVPPHHTTTTTTTPYLSPDYPARLVGYGNCRNVDVDAFPFDSCLRCGAGILAATWTQHNSSMIDGLRAIHDEREGEYEGYCCCEILLTRLQQSPDVILLSEVQEMTECTPPFGQNMFSPWSSHDGDLFLSR